VRDKQAYRERAWDLLTHEHVARFPGARGRIPNFVGAEAAARALVATREWARAENVKSNPDAPQLPVRTAALEDGKLLFMAVPRLREAEPFLLLDPAALTVPPRRAASIRGSSASGRPVSIEDMPRIDLVVCGSVAVNRSGARIGKGGGYSDIEFALLTEVKKVDHRTVVATTVHPLQMFDEELPESRHDFRVDLIVTPEEVIRVPRSDRRRPPGIVWQDLDEEKIAAIPVLAELADTRGA
jgi:5-formyltetrahydrofolate cyclo-ligase